MATFNGLDAKFKKYVEELAQKAMSQGNNVKNTVVDELIDSIDKNVYIPYKPRQYDRDKDDGGLTDPSNFELDETKDGVAIYSTREATDRKGQDVYALDIIEGYNQYSIPDKWGYGYEEPRHTVEPARENLRNSDKLANALKKDMQNIGLDVK